MNLRPPAPKAGTLAKLSYAPWFGGKKASHSLAAWAAGNVGADVHTVGMADIEILEVRAFEARCLECGETGPIETSVFFAMVWEEAHACAALRIDAEAAELAAAS